MECWGVRRVGGEAFLGSAMAPAGPAGILFSIACIKPRTGKPASARLLKSANDSFAEHAVISSTLRLSIFCNISGVLLIIFTLFANTIYLS